TGGATRLRKRRGLSSSAPCSALRLIALQLALAVHPLPQFLARLEMRDELLGHVDLLAGLGVTADTRRPVVQTETAEPANLDALPVHETIRHRVENHLDGELGVLGHQLRISGRQTRDQLRLGHARLPFALTARVTAAHFCCRVWLSATRRGWCYRSWQPLRSAAWPRRLLPQRCPSP